MTAKRERVGGDADPLDTPREKHRSNVHRVRAHYAASLVGRAREVEETRTSERAEGRPVGQAELDRRGAPR